MHNITLIGMPGSGKTTFGKTLAAGLSYHFIDTDDVIIQTYHKPLMELIDEYGTEGFITLEGKVLQSIYTNQAVISTGGSAVYSDDAMQYLKSTGIVIYLHHSWTCWHSVSAIWSHGALSATAAAPHWKTSMRNAARCTRNTQTSL